jgi:putative ABC transport system substrate-binding protein
MSICLRRREFITLLGGAAAWPLAARAQQRAMPVVGYVSVAGDTPERERAFRQGLGEAGYSEGRNVTVEYHILDGKFDRLPAVMADLVRRRVAAIAALGGAPALAARAATTTIPIAFAVSQDPVKLGLVASLARPGGNATGFNFFNQETQAKRLSLLHQLVPKAVRIGLLVNPTNAPPIAEADLREVLEAAPTIGLQIQVVNASTIGEINAAFAALVRERADALFVTADGFFAIRRVQFATLRSDTRRDSGGLFAARVRGSWRADELRNQPDRCVAASRRVYRQHPQGRRARRTARPTGRQVRLRHQPGNRDAARHRGAAATPRHRNRGDRMIQRREFITLLGASALGY